MDTKSKKSGSLFVRKPGRTIVSVLCATTLAASLCPGFAIQALANEGTSNATRSGLALATTSDALQAQDLDLNALLEGFTGKATDALVPIAATICKAAGIEYDVTKSPEENIQAAIAAANIKGEAAKKAVVTAACKAAGVEYDEAKTPAENAKAALEAVSATGKAKAEEAAQKAAEAACKAAGIEYDATKTPTENAQAAIAAARAAAKSMTETAKQAVAQAATKAAGVAYDKAKSAAANIDAALKAAGTKASKSAEAVAKAACKIAGIKYDTSKSVANNIAAAIAAAIEAATKPAAGTTDIALAEVTVKNAKYTGKEVTPAVTVKISGKTLVSGTDYDALYINNVQAGTGAVIVMGKNSYGGASYQTFVIKKAANTMVAKAKKKIFTYKASTLAKKNMTITKAKAFKITKAKGAVKFSKKSASKAIKNKVTINSAGKITLKKGIKAGTYKLKAKVRAAGNSNYKAKAAYVTFTIKVTKK